MIDVAEWEVHGFSDETPIVDFCTFQPNEFTRMVCRQVENNTADDLPVVSCSMFFEDNMLPFVYTERRPKGFEPHSSYIPDNWLDTWNIPLTTNDLARLEYVEVETGVGGMFYRGYKCTNRIEGEQNIEKTLLADIRRCGDRNVVILMLVDSHRVSKVVTLDEIMKYHSDTSQGISQSRYSYS